MTPAEVTVYGKGYRDGAGAAQRWASAALLCEAEALGAELAWIKAEPFEVIFGRAQ